MNPGHLGNPGKVGFFGHLHRFFAHNSMPSGVVRAPGMVSSPAAVNEAIVQPHIVTAGGVPISTSSSLPRGLSAAAVATSTTTPSLAGFSAATLSSLAATRSAPLCAARFVAPGQHYYAFRNYPFWNTSYRRNAYYGYPGLSGFSYFGPMFFGAPFLGYPLGGYGGGQTDPAASYSLSNMIAGPQPLNNGAYNGQYAPYAQIPPYGQYAPYGQYGQNGQYAPYGQYGQNGQYPPYGQIAQYGQNPPLFDPNSSAYSADPSLSALSDPSYRYVSPPNAPYGYAPPVTPDAQNYAELAAALQPPSIGGAGYFGDYSSAIRTLPEDTPAVNSGQPEEAAPVENSNMLSSLSSAGVSEVAPFAGVFWRLPNPGGILSTCFAHQNPAMDYFLNHRWDALSIALNKSAAEQLRNEQARDSSLNPPTAMTSPDTTAGSSH